MANAVYPKFLEALWTQPANSNASSGTVKAALVDTGTYTYSAAQTVTAPLVDSGSQIYGPTLRLNVTAPLVDAGAQAYAPSVAIVGPQTVAVPLVDSGAEVFVPRFGGQDGHGFVLVDFEPKLWWKRKPKALDEQEAAEKIASVARQIERVAVKQVKAGRVVQPVVSKPAKAEILQAIAPQLQQMPGFDPVELYRAILERLIQQEQQRQAEQQAQQIAAQEIERIRLMELDEDETIILLMGA